MSRTNPIESAISRVRRRLLITRAVSVLGRWMLYGAIGALGVIAVDRLSGDVIPDLAGPILAGVLLVVGIIDLWRHRPDRHEAAHALDERLELRDRIATGAWLASAPEIRESLAETALRDAEHAASRVDIRRAAPMPRPDSLLGAAGLAGVAAAVWAFVPSWTVIEIPGVPTAAQVALEEARKQREQEAAEVIEDAAEQVRVISETLARNESEDEAVPGEAGEPDEATRRALESLDRLSRQMRGSAEGAGSSPEQTQAEASGEAAGDDPDQTLAAAAEELETLSRELERQAAIREEAADRVARELSQARPEQVGEEGAESHQATERFTEALERGDLAEAAEAVEELARQLPEMSEEERRAASEELRQMAERLQQRAEETEAQRQARQEAMREALEQSGLDPQEAVGETPEETEQRLREQGIDPETARELAERLERERQSDEAAEQAARDLERTARDLEEFARQAETTPEQQPGEQQAGEQQPGEQQPGGQQSGEQQSGEQQSGEQQPGEQQPGEQQPGEQQSGEQQSGEQQAGDPTAPPEPGVQPGGEQSPQGAAESLQRTLESLDRARREAQQSREASREIREQAQRLWEQMTPEERQEAEAWARQLAEEQGDLPPQGADVPGGSQAGAGQGRQGPAYDPMAQGFETEDVRLQGADEEGEQRQARTIAELYGQGPTPADDRIDREAMLQQQRREAAEGVQRALDQQSISARYRKLVREWARRAAETPSEEE